MAGAEGVVDVDVAEGGELLGEGLSPFCSPGWKRRFSSTSTSPGLRACTAAVTRGPTTSSTLFTGLPSSSPRRAATLSMLERGVLLRDRPWAGRGGSSR